ncbi:tetratricopeptide repeat protein [Croceibacterium sp. TMG7-5b_MA50]|uniref:tetratricopeptide repeat protein n=1 Tax=Croceibacterium sp. TMG7-5b_MA50 TaxID=3121290 RepID=UPI0032218CE6
MASPTDYDTARAERLAARRQAEENVLVREIDEAVRKEEFASKVRRYAIPIGLGVLALLLALGGWLLWRDWQANAAEKRSEQLVSALDEMEGGSREQAEKELAAIAEDGNDAAALSARLAQAGLALRGERRDEALAIYRTMSADDAAPKPYRDIATIRLAAAEFEDVQPQVIIDRLKPLAVPGNPWFGSAGELVAMAYLKQNRTDLAGPLLVQVARDEAVPPSLRSRTRQLAGMLGFDAVDDADLQLEAPGGAAPATAQQD